QSQPPQSPVIHQPSQEMSIQEMEDLKQQYLDEMKRLINSDYRDEIKIDELEGNFNSMSIEINKKEKLQQLEQVANLSTYPSKRFNSFCYDDDEDYTIVITPDFSITDSLIMKNEHLDNISKTKSDEFIKSSVENLVLIPSESEDFSDIESDCDMPDCDDSQTTNFSMFSNPLFDDSTSSDDESSHEEVIHEMSFKLIRTLFLILTRKSFLSYLLESLLNRDESIPPGIDSGDSDSEGDNLSLDRLLHDDHIPLSNILYFSNVVRVFLPFFTYLVTSLILFSSRSEDTIFDPGISDYHISSFLPDVSHRKHVANLSTYPSKRFNSFCYDDDEDYTVVITPDFPITDSLIMENEHLDTIPITESDKFIKSCVENLIPIPSESDDFSDIESECDMPDCDDSQMTKFSTFSNPLFDDSTSSDDESSHEEVIYEMSFKTYSNPLFDLKEEIISSEFNPTHNEDLDSNPKNDRFDIKSYLLESLLNRDTLMAFTPKFDSLLEVFSGELAHTDLIPPGINEANYDPEEDIHLVERLLYYLDSEGDNLSLDRLLHDDPIPLSDILDFSNVVRVFLSFFTYPVTSSILLPSRS
nr:hypothetical protein [Tanacetum cinerariifolium]